MKLVEVIRGVETSDETVAALSALCRQIGKEGIECLDSPGFVVNRLLVPLLNEAIFAVFEGVAEPAGIDKCMQLGANHPMGPLSLCDMIGLDTILSVMEVLHREFGDDKYRACPLLRKMVKGAPRPVLCALIISMVNELSRVVYPVYENSAYAACALWRTGASRRPSESGSGFFVLPKMHGQV